MAVVSRSRCDSLAAASHRMLAVTNAAPAAPQRVTDVQWPTAQPGQWTPRVDDLRATTRAAHKAVSRSDSATDLNLQVAEQGSRNVTSPGFRKRAQSRLTGKLGTLAGRGEPDPGLGR